MRALVRRVWVAWKPLAASIGDFQARLLLTVFYFVVAAPFAFVVRWISRPGVRGVSNWIRRSDAAASLAEARRQG